MDKNLRILKTTAELAPIGHMEVLEPRHAFIIS